VAKQKQQSCSRPGAFSSTKASATTSDKKKHNIKHLVVYSFLIF